jgi:hypothetical protein
MTSKIEMYQNVRPSANRLLYCYNFEKNERNKNPNNIIYIIYRCDNTAANTADCIWTMSKESLSTAWMARFSTIVVPCARWTPTEVSPPSSLFCSVSFSFGRFLPVLLLPVGAVGTDRFFGIHLVQMLGSVLNDIICL